MPRPNKVKYIVIHCTAGFGDVNSIKRYWKETLGWRSVGYHRIVGLNGEIHKLADFSKYTNGVRGFNGESIHISYIGGVDKNDYNKAIDTRTYKQKHGLVDCITEALKWLEDNGVDVSNIEIKGHRDFSPDQNGNGKIESWERIKECPSFDAIEEYSNLI